MNEQRRIETEEVGEAAKPPRARVDTSPSGEAETPSAAETFARKRDYLEGFISRPPRTAAEPRRSSPAATSMRR
jgi:hypothetical protein